MGDGWKLEVQCIEELVGERERRSAPQIATLLFNQYDSQSRGHGFWKLSQMYDSPIRSMSGNETRHLLQQSAEQHCVQLNGAAINKH